MTVAEARDVLGTSRKYILPLLEHMEPKITRRLETSVLHGVM